MKRFFVALVVAAISLFVSGCQANTAGAIMNNVSANPVDVLPIAINGPMKAANAEISGLALWNDAVVLLPQYPDEYASERDDGTIYYLPIHEIEKFIIEPNNDPIQPQPISMDLDGLIGQIPGYEGFEALTFFNREVFFTIEARQDAGMMGYVVKGVIEKGGDEWIIRLDSHTLTAIEPQADIDNMTDEAMMVFDGVIYTFYEANGASVNTAPVVHRFTTDLAEIDPMPMTNVPFRLTDVSLPDGDGNFWGMNYFYPSDTPVQGDFGTDPFSMLEKDAQLPGVVERIVPLTVMEDGSVVRGDAELISLTLLADEARNWEGLVWLPDAGFVMVTDRYPTTILGFVPLP